MVDLDPHWEWLAVEELGKRDPIYIKGRCKHLELEPVESADGEDIARLCLTCDQIFYRGSALTGGLPRGKR